MQTRYSHRLAATLIVPFAAVLATAADRFPVSVGEPAPEVQLDAWLSQAGTRLEPPSLKGKAVVLEFWATWCGPCVQAISHLNELAEKFEGKPIQFIAVTAEERNIVTAFLKKRTIRGTIGLDTSKALHRAYSIDAIPQTVLIDTNGTIAGLLNPLELTEQRLADLLLTKTEANPPLSRLRVVSTADPQNATIESSHSMDPVQPLFQILVRRSSETNNAFGSGSRRHGWTASGVTVRDILPRAFGPFADRILVDTELPEDRYDFIFNPGSIPADESASLLRSTLKAAFGLDAKSVKLETNALALRISNPNAPGLTVASTDAYYIRSAPGQLTGTALSWADLSRALERRLNVPVIDETGSTNRYDVRLSWKDDPADIQGRELCASIKRELGLTLQPVRRSIEMWSITEATTN